MKLRCVGANLYTWATGCHRWTTVRCRYCEHAICEDHRVPSGGRGSWRCDDRDGCAAREQHNRYLDGFSVLVLDHPAREDDA